MNLEHKVTRGEEELQTFKRFLTNDGKPFDGQKLIQDRANLLEPADLLYGGVGYQITYGDRKNLSEFRKKLSKGGIHTSIRSIEKSSYARTLLEGALIGKRDKSDTAMTLLIDSSYSAYGNLSNRESLLVRYFKKCEVDIGGSWKSIFVVFPDGNVQLR